MNVVLDAYAVIAALVDERAKTDTEPLMPKGTVSAANLAEIVDVCVRVHANDERIVRERIGWLMAGGLEVAPLDTCYLTVRDPADQAAVERRRAWLGE